MNPQFCSQTKMKTYQPWVFWFQVKLKQYICSIMMITIKKKIYVKNQGYGGTPTMNLNMVIFGGFKSRNVKVIMLNINYSVLSEL